MCEAKKFLMIRAYVVVVSCQDGNTRAGLPVPNANGLVIRAADNPRILLQTIRSADFSRRIDNLVEESCANIIQMPQESKKTTALLVVPELSRVNGENAKTCPLTLIL
jgi:hypothetical protein